jgi:transglutaminase-like putative cysteine protease
MIALFFCVGILSVNVDGPSALPWWDARVEASLKRSPARKEAWEKTLATTPPEHRSGMAYLIADLPLGDLEGLSPEVLAANVALAYRVRGEVLWGPGLREDIFLDAVLPHASVTEPRDLMRAEFHDRYLPLVKDCKTPGEAAQKINKLLFADYKVGYNTRRLRTDQSSKETIAQGMATCTGLSIMLVEACRAVGVPARLAGINSWPGRGGNHTWAEVWDGGWHFVGASEPDANGLDHAWFVGDASKALKDSPRNAIWAVTYRSTGDHFPLVWNSRAQVNAENVTDRYTRGAPKGPAQPRLMVEVRRGGQRVEADVTALDRETGATLLAGKSLGPQADINLHLSVPAAPGESFLVVARYQGVSASLCATVKEDTVVRLDIDHPDADSARTEVAGLLTDRFGADAAKRAVAEKLLAELPFDEGLRGLAWQAYKASPAHADLRKEYESKTVKTPDRTSPYLWRHVGQKPKEGWSLVIAMHGGGGAAKRVNDSQWMGMFERYYKDHPEAGGYVYLALRAPNDAWNGFYDDAICPLIERLIRQFVLFGDVNPDRVYILGASHGGYGAFVIGPKIPDRFAAVHASASAPTDGETMGENLRNTRFTFMVGEKDTAYGRAERCQAFAKQVETWRKQRGGYSGSFEWRPDVGHSVPDRDKVAEMIKAGPRDPHPKELVWVQSDGILKHFFWIEAPKPAEKGRVEASITSTSNRIWIKSEGQAQLALWLDGNLVDLARPITVEVAGGETRQIIPKPTLGTYCLSLEERGDPRLAAPARIVVPLKP